MKTAAIGLAHMPSRQPTFQELEESAQTVIGYLKTFPEYSNARVAITGGLAFWKYFPDNAPSTLDVDFIVTIPGAPYTVRTRLVDLHGAPFEQNALFFAYKHPGGVNIRIDLDPEWQFPYLPAAAVTLASIAPNHIPYVGMVDLLAMKVKSCGLRQAEDQGSRDAEDTITLATTLSASGRVLLNDAQKTAIQQGLDDVMTQNGKDYAWWNSHLHLQ